MLSKLAEDERIGNAPPVVLFSTNKSFKPIIIKIERCLEEVQERQSGGGEKWREVGAPKRASNDE